MTIRAPGRGRYAHAEREQRWLLESVPEGASSPTEIVDRYINGTRLRLRRAEHDGTVLFKFGQKVRVNEASPELVNLTNIYLGEPEYDVLAGLPAHELRKTRLQLADGGRTFAVDVFHGSLAGLILAETELDEAEPLLPRPVFAIADVTHDDRYSGGALAQAGLPTDGPDQHDKGREP